MANTTMLQKITRRAKQIQRAHPKMKYVDAQRQAGREIKKGKKVGTIKKKATKRKAPAKRFKTVKTVSVRKRVGTAKPTASKRKVLEDKLGREYVRFYNETTIRGTDISRKKMAEIKRELKKIKK